MRKLAVYLALVLPALGLGWWAAFPQTDPRLAAPLFHFYIVTFTTFAATVLSLLVTISVGQTALPRHLLLATAFAWMGAVFFTHGVTTPGAITAHFHPAIQWGAWLTLLGGGVLFLIGAFAPSAPNPRFLRAVAAGTLLAYASYAAVAALAPEALLALQQLGDPPVDAVVFVLTLIVWLVSGGQHYRNYRRTANAFDGLMAFESVWYATATVSMFRFALWQASWWLYHGLLLLGFLIAVYALWRAYEQIRAFRLTRYYAAASLIVTAALALLSAQLYSQQVYRSLLEQLEGESRASSLNIAASLAAELGPISGADDLRRLGAADDLAARMRQRIAGLAIKAVALYDAQGMAVFSTEPAEVGRQAEAGAEDLQAALRGQTVFELFAPGAPPPAYQPAAAVHVLQAYVPFAPLGGDADRPLAVLTTSREAPELSRAQIASRRFGMGLAAASLGALFLALLAIVRRADRILARRSRELERAYADLRQSEGLRDDLTNMIVHDLRNPLTALTANMELLAKVLGNVIQSDAPPRLLASARASGQRMMGLIDDLLSVGKFEAGELRPILTPVYLPALLIEQEESYRGQAHRESKTLSLAILAPKEACTVPADAGLISRVVDNLIGNALKYTTASGRVDISAEVQDNHLVVRVRDDGQGIPREYHQRIFDKFVQVTDAAGVSPRKGTGLGLAFCRLAVEAHQGKIWVESAPGQGSTFSFSLPRKPR